MNARARKIQEARERLLQATTIQGGRRKFGRRIPEGRHLEIDKTCNLFAFKKKLPGIGVDESGTCPVLWHITAQPSGSEPHQWPRSPDQPVKNRFGGCIKVTRNRISTLRDIQTNFGKGFRRQPVDGCHDFHNFFAYFFLGINIGDHTGVDNSGYAFKH